jgi:predicted CopG family antitoxin
MNLSIPYAATQPFIRVARGDTPALEFQCSNHPLAYPIAQSICRFTGKSKLAEKYMLMKMISYMQVLMMTEYIRTTIKLREDVYQTLKKEAGAKNISEKINEILIKMLFREKKSLFGTMQKTDLSDLRDHEDRL